MNLENYRPITLMSTFYKLFTRILGNRAEQTLDENQPREQAGFRRRFGTLDHLFTINQVVQKSQEYQLPLCMAFIDYEKAFDSIRTSSMIKAITNQGVDQPIVDTLDNIYHSATSCIRLHATSDFFRIGKGVRQGDTISPKLFTATLEEAFKKVDWNGAGLPIND